MSEDQAFKDIERMVGAFFASWSIQLATAVTLEDKVRRLCSAGDYGSLFDSITLHVDSGDFGEQLNEVIEDFLFMRSTPSQPKGNQGGQPRWDMPVLTLLKEFQEEYCQ
jgi:hypothetical protein